MADAPLPTVTVTQNSAFVLASAAIETTLLRVVGIREIDISTRARAERGGDPYCVILTRSDGTGLELNSDSRLEAACGVYVNSTGSEAAFLNSRSVLNAPETCIGGRARTNSGSVISPAPKLGCPAKADPLASLPEPAQAQQSCQHNNLVVNSGSRTLMPGVYCGLLELNAGADVRFEPGIYVIRDGELKINSNSRLAGDGVMLFFQGEKGRLNVNSGSRISLSAPRDGQYAGIVMFQSRAPITLKTDYHIVNSDGNTRLEGVIYLPNGKIMLNSLSDANKAAAYTVMVAREARLNSFGRFFFNNDYASGPPLPASLRGLARSKEVRLVQ